MCVQKLFAYCRLDSELTAQDDEVEPVDPCATDEWFERCGRIPFEPSFDESSTHTLVSSVDEIHDDYFERHCSAPSDEVMMIGLSWARAL